MRAATGYKRRNQARAAVQAPLSRRRCAAYEKKGTSKPMPAASMSRPTMMAMAEAIVDRCFCSQGCSLISAWLVVPVGVGDNQGEGG